MPHIILETPKSFDVEKSEQIIKMTQSILVKELPAKIESFKNRVYQYDYCLVADSTDKQILALTIKVLSGRSEELLIKASQIIKKSIENLLFANKFTITVEILELSPAYTK